MRDYDSWDFSVELEALLAVDLTVNDCRWLVCKGLVEHACEIPSEQDATRRFRPEAMLAFSRNSCFVLTEGGMQFAAELQQRAQRPAVQALAAPLSGAERRGDTVPMFRCDRRELLFRNQVVKRFRLEAPNQERILIAFQEEAWPVRIDDPLPPRAGIDAKQCGVGHSSCHRGHNTWHGRTKFLSRKTNYRAADQMMGGREGRSFAASL